MQLRKQLGYPSDGSVNLPLKGLITNGYVKEDVSKEGSAFPLTQKGRNKIFFLRLPDRLLFVIGALGIVNIYVGVANLLSGIALNPYTDIVSGGSLLTIFLVVRLLRRRLANEFLDIREPLEESENIPRENREDISSS